MTYFCFLGFVALLGVQVSYCSPAALVTTTKELFDAVGYEFITKILLNDTLTISAKDWPQTVNLTRSVVISGTPQRMAARTYVLLDFNNMAMMFRLAPGVTMRFRGLELVNHYDTVGPSVRPLRQSVGATAIFDNCMQRRRAGLPYKAAIVNMLQATRPEGMSGPQVCLLVSNLTFSSTRSSTQLVYSQAINMADYATTVTPDSSLAYQNLYYGGYMYITQDSYYVVDHMVSDDCMAVRPGTDCVTLLLKQLEADEQEVGAQQMRQSGSAEKERKIIIAVVVPVTVVAIAGVAATAILQWQKRRRRRLPKSYWWAGGAEVCVSAHSAYGGKGRVAALPAAAAVGDAKESGCVFLGLEEDQQTPEWSPLAADLAVEEDNDAPASAHGSKVTARAVTSLFTDTDTAQLQLIEANRRIATVGSSDMAMSGRGREAEEEGGGVINVGGQQQQGRSSRAVPPSVSTSDAPPSSDPPPPTAKVKNQVDGNGRGGGSGGGGADGAVITAAASPTACSSDVATSGLGRGGSRSDPDIQAELGRMAQELRASVKDEAIRLEGIIGSGSFGIVYKGTWQGLEVAVKTLVFSATNENRRRALQEAALCASISHPNIVATYSSELQPLGTLGAGGTHSVASAEGRAENVNPERLSQILEWRLYIVQEYADGGPLRKLYGNRALWPSPGVVNLPAVVSLAVGIARALVHLHSKRIIHGDLNPNNVLLKQDDNEPSGYAIKVGDFGLSVMLPHNRTHISNLRMGTMFYMCPAVVMKSQVGPPSDIFSLGVMLWELYHGRRAGIRTDQGPRYSSIFPAFPPTCPEAYRAVALNCLQRQPQNRPSAALAEQHLGRLLAAVTIPVANAMAPAPEASPGRGSGQGPTALGCYPSQRRPPAPVPVASVCSSADGSSTMPPTQFPPRCD